MAQILNQHHNAVYEAVKLMSIPSSNKEGFPISTNLERRLRVLVKDVKKKLPAVFSLIRFLYVGHMSYDIIHTAQAELEGLILTPAAYTIDLLPIYMPIDNVGSSTKVLVRQTNQITFLGD